MVSRGIPTPGRARQKSRTRQALLEAAVRLVERNEQPRLAAVAAEAGVSRATAYRYFPSEQALLREAPLARKFAAAEDVLRGCETATVEERVLVVHRYVYGHAVANESHFRLFLSAVHEQAALQDGEGGTPRAGRRRKMFELALAPIRRELGTRALHRLRDALTALTGIDALVVMQDVCGLSARRGRDTMEWAICELLRSALGPLAQRRGPT